MNFVSADTKKSNLILCAQKCPSHARLITTIKSPAPTSFFTMLAVEHYSELFADVALSKNELLEIHRSKISLHREKADYRYPTIRAL
jgi:hypothetical protein